MRMTREDVEARVQHIEGLIAAADVESARLRLMDLARELNQRDLIREATAWSGRWALWQQEKRLGAARPEDRERLVGNLLEILEKARISTPQSSPPRATRTGILATVWDGKKRPPEDGSLLRAENLQKTFKRGGSEFSLSDVSFSLKSHQITGIVGLNSSGKTTLIRILAGDLAPDRGSVSIGTTTQKRPGSDDYKRSVAWVPQELPRWPGRLSDQLHLIAALNGKYGEENEEQIAFWLERLDVTPWKDSTWKQISGGTKTRFSLIAALLSRPEVLLLDEPLAALDLISRHRILMDLRELADSVTHPLAVLFSSQDIHEVEAIADQMICLLDGKIAYNGPARAMLGEGGTFEVAWSGSRVALQDALGPDLLSAEPIAGGWIVWTRSGLLPSDILSRLESKGATPTLYRDLSSSLARMLWEQGRTE